MHLRYYIQEGDNLKMLKIIVHMWIIETSGTFKVPALSEDINRFYLFFTPF